MRKAEKKVAAKVTKKAEAKKAKKEEKEEDEDDVYVDPIEANIKNLKKEDKKEDKKMRLATKDNKKVSIKKTETSSPVKAKLSKLRRKWTINEFIYIWFSRLFNLNKI